MLFCNSAIGLSVVASLASIVVFIGSILFICSP